MYFTLNHPTGAPDPLSARSIPAVVRLNRPFEIGPIQDTRKVFPLDGSGTNSRTPSFNGWPSRVTVPLAGTRLTPPQPASPTRAATRTHPTPTRGLSNRELMSVTSGGEQDGMRNARRPDPMGPAAGRRSRLPAVEGVAVVRDAGVQPRGSGDAG